MIDTYTDIEKEKLEEFLVSSHDIVHKIITINNDYKTCSDNNKLNRVFKCDIIKHYYQQNNLHEIITNNIHMSRYDYSILVIKHHAFIHIIDSLKNEQILINNDYNKFSNIFRKLNIKFRRNKCIKTSSEYNLYENLVTFIKGKCSLSNEMIRIIAEMINNMELIINKGCDELMFN